MTCHDARDLYSALVDDALDASERAALEAHLAGCAECRRELERFRGTVRLLHAAPAVRAPVGFVDRVLAAARPVPWHRWWRERLFSPLRVKLPLQAAGVLLVAGIAVYVFQHTPELQQATRHEAPPAPASTPRAAPPVAPAPPAEPSRTLEAARRDEAPDEKAKRATPAEPGRGEAPQAFSRTAPAEPHRAVTPPPAAQPAPSAPSARENQAAPSGPAPPPAIAGSGAPPPPPAPSDGSRGASGGADRPGASPTAPPPAGPPSEALRGGRSKLARPGASPAPSAPAAAPEGAKKAAAPPDAGRSAPDAGRNAEDAVAKARGALEGGSAGVQAPARDRVLPSVMSEQQQADRQRVTSPREEKTAAAPAVPPPAASAPAAPAPPAQRPLMKSAPGGAASGADVRERQTETAARAQEDQRRAAPMPPASDVSALLSVADREASLRGLDDLVARAGARTLARRADGEMAVVEILVPREAYADFVLGLSRLGRFVADREPATPPAPVRLILRIGS